MGANREYKDSVFRMLFKEPENARELYQGLTGETAALEDIHIDPVGGVFTSELKHDVAFRVGNRLLFLIEHMSTSNRNMPVRMLIGAAEFYHRYIKSLGKRAIHRKQRLSLPAPEFLLFTNGRAAKDGEGEMRLSEAFGGKGALELVVRVYDVRYDSGQQLLKKCPVLEGYSLLVHQVEQGKAQGLGDEAAIRRAILFCKENNILSKFLERNNEEVQQAMMFEWSMEDALEARREDGLEEGREEGREEANLSAVRNLMRNLHLNAQQAMDALNIPVVERGKLEAQL